MDRVYESGAASKPPTAPQGAVPGFPTGGDPLAAIPATRPGAWWFHMITEELRAVVEASGIQASPAELDQLLRAIRKMFLAVSGGTLSGSLAMKGDWLGYMFRNTAGHRTATIFASPDGGILLQVHKGDASAEDGSGPVLQLTYNKGNGELTFLGRDLGRVAGLDPATLFLLDGSRKVAGSVATKGDWNGLIVENAGGRLCGAVVADPAGNLLIKAISDAGVDLPLRLGKNGVLQWKDMDLGRWASESIFTGGNTARIPGGRILQWGHGSAGGVGSSWLTFPSAFPAACHHVAVTGVHGGDGVPGVVGVVAGSNWSRTGFSLGANTVPAGYAWLAIGE